MKKILLFTLFCASLYSLFAQNTCDPNPIPNHDFSISSNGNRPDFWEKEDKVGIKNGDCGVTVSNNGLLRLTTCTEYLIDPFTFSITTFVFPNSATTNPFPISGNPIALTGKMGYNKDKYDDFICEIFIFDDCYNVIGKAKKYWKSTVFEDIDIPIVYSQNKDAAYASIGFFLLPSFGLDMGEYTAAVIGDLEFSGNVTKPKPCPAPNYLHATTTPNYAYVNWDEDECADFYTLRYRKEGTTTWNTITNLKKSEVDTIGFQPCTTYELQAKTKRKDGSISEFTGSYFLQMKGCVGNGNCTSFGKNTTKSYIERVAFKDLSPRIDSSKQNAHGYYDNRQFQFYYYSGTSLNIKPKAVAANEKLYWQVWIDVNNNKTLEANELLAKGTTTGLEEFKSSVISLPANVANAILLLRIQMSRTPNISACEKNFEGETRDYSLKSTVSACGAATDINVQDIKNSSAKIEWLGSVDSIRLRETGSTKWYSFAPSTYYLSLVGFSPCTDYEIQSVTKCNGSLEYSDIYYYHTSGCNDYCKAYGIQQDYISSVNFNTLSAYTGKNEGYSDYSNCTKVEAGKTYKYTATPAFPSGTTSQPEYWRVYIDYNEDKDFDDAGELVFDSGKAVSGSIYTDITIPANTQPGMKRIRTVMKRLTATDATPPTACGSFTYGEVEDYQVNVIAAVPVAPTAPVIAVVGATKFCEGGSTTLKAPDGFNYSWSNGSTTQNITATKSGTYTLTVTDKINGLSSSSSPLSITVFANPQLTVTGEKSICTGASLSLFATGSGSIVWNSGSTNPNLVVPNITTSGTYGVTLTDANQCKATENIAVNVLPLPQVAITGNTNICAGNTLNLTATGTGTFVWNDGTNGSNLTTPNSTTPVQYIVTVTDANKCKNTATVQTKILPLPNIQIASNPGSAEACEKTSVQLIAVGGTTYTWTGNGVSQTTNNSTNAIVKVGANPFSVEGKDANGCSNKASLVFTGISAPQINAVASNNDICLGDKITLVAIGAATYNWFSKAEGGLKSSIGNNVSAQPTALGKIQYQVLGENIKGCVSDTFNLQINVKNCSSAVNENDFLSKIKVYPNPFNAEITIENSDNKALRSYLFNMQGHLLNSFFINSNKQTFSVENLPIGAYKLVIFDENKVVKSVVLEKI